MAAVSKAAGRPGAAPAGGVRSALQRHAGGGGGASDLPAAEDLGPRWRAQAVPKPEFRAGDYKKTGYAGFPVGTAGGHAVPRRAGGAAKSLAAGVPCGVGVDRDRTACRLFFYDGLIYNRSLAASEVTRSDPRGPSVKADRSMNE
eukprot:1186146-Prorocentrum_minimum.AAC.1